MNGAKPDENKHRMPDFLILGAQKAGSTWLYETLKTHPAIFLPSTVELHHFNKLTYNDPTQIAEYASHFDGIPSNRVAGEKTASYFWTRNVKRSQSQPPASHNPDIPGSVKATLGPDIKLIVSLRHPVRRAISAYGHHGRKKRIAAGTTLRDVAHSKGILDIGFYADHLSAWEANFDPRQILITIFESDIVANPLEGYRRACHFLGVDTSTPPESIYRPSNAGALREELGETMSFSIPGLEDVRPDDVAFLLDAYADDMARLRTRLGERIDCWDEETEALKKFAARRY